MAELTSEDLKGKAEVKLRLENGRKGKAPHDAMIASPFGLCEAASVAEHEGGTEITIDVSLRRRVEAISNAHGKVPVRGS